MCVLENETEALRKSVIRRCPGRILKVTRERDINASNGTCNINEDADLSAVTTVFTSTFHSEEAQRCQSSGV